MSILLPVDGCLMSGKYTTELNGELYMSQYTTKPAIRPVRPAKTQISLYIHPVWQGFSFTPLRIVQRLYKANAISKDSDQIVWMCRLILVFAGHTSLIVGFVVHWLT